MIADSGATPISSFRPASRAEQHHHGPDSQVILLTPDAFDIARKVAEAVERQLAELPRATARIVLPERQSSDCDQRFSAVRRHL